MTVVNDEGRGLMARGARSILLRLILGLAALLFLYGEGVSQRILRNTQNPLAGSRVYGAKGCARCHSIKGVGGTIGPDLGQMPGSNSFYDLAAAMWNHFPAMAARVQEVGISAPALRLSPRETDDLIAFLASVNYLDLDGDPQVGKRLFAKKGCIVCHQIGSVGGVVGPRLDFFARGRSPISVAAAMWNHGPGMVKAMRERGVEYPIFHKTELRDLIAYLKSVASEKMEHTKVSTLVLPGLAERGQRVFTDKLCINCHAVRGQGGKMGPDLADRRVHQSLLEFAAAMWNKAPAMMKEMTRKYPFPELQAKEMADLIAYLYSVRYFAEPGDPRRGEELLLQKGCILCHSVGDKDASSGLEFERVQGLDPVTIIATMWNHAISMEPKVRNKGMKWPVITGNELADLVAHLHEKKIRSRSN